MSVSFTQQYCGHFPHSYMFFYVIFYVIISPLQSHFTYYLSAWEEGGAQGPSEQTEETLTSSSFQTRRRQFQNDCLVRRGTGVLSSGWKPGWELGDGEALPWGHLQGQVDQRKVVVKLRARPRPPQTSGPHSSRSPSTGLADQPRSGPPHTFPLLGPSSPHALLVLSPGTRACLPAGDCSVPLLSSFTVGRPRVQCLRASPAWWHLHSGGPAASITGCPEGAASPAVSVKSSRHELLEGRLLPVQV